MAGMDISRAQLTNSGTHVQITDPEWPWTLDVYVSEDPSLPGIIGLVIWAREVAENGAVFRPPLTSAALAEIPVRALARVAASALAGEGEAQLRMLALPRPKGLRSWPPDHFSRVSTVAAWARRTLRPGGAVSAVSEFWAVHPRTARRWLEQLP